MCSKFYAQRINAEGRVKEEMLRAEGYGKLHEDVIGKLRIVTEKNHSLEIELQKTRHDNLTLRNQLEEMERRMKCLQSNLGNYSQEVNVSSVNQAIAKLHCIS